ncbi:MAG: Asp-tRNA(Asn)/Glu-tRNA(Gln) amidotransferase subunit GatC [Oscillospiraceae bacterium]|nr:Asp-tRNA(Asn)/Glu-tRNA(Gln) amidotransferase subunit GatC [Oscillospiraceae bacterium]
MQITKETVEYAANLSRIKLDESETEEMRKQISEIVGYMEILNQINTDDAGPLAHISDIKNVMREDTAAPSYDRSEILKNAPDKNEEYFIVPKAVEQG